MKQWMKTAAAALLLAGTLAVGACAKDKQTDARETAATPEPITYEAQSEVTIDLE